MVSDKDLSEKVEDCTTSMKIVVCVVELVETVVEFEMVDVGFAGVELGVVEFEMIVVGFAGVELGVVEFEMIVAEFAGVELGVVEFEVVVAGIELAAV